MRHLVPRAFPLIALSGILWANPSEAPTLPRSVLMHSPAPQTPAAVEPAAPPPSIRIETEDVAVREMLERPRARPPRRKAEPQRRPLFYRAARLLVGSGRHRPEPFPRGSF